MHRAAASPPVVLGTSWRRHGARRQRAARVARLLRPTAHVLGGLVSTEVAVPHAGRWYRPDAAVVDARAVPPDGMLPCGPPLVVRLGGPLSGEAWLATGTHTVWTVDDGVVRQLSRGRRPRVLTAGDWLEHPAEPALRLPATALLEQPARGRLAA